MSITIDTTLAPVQVPPPEKMTAELTNRSAQGEVVRQHPQRVHRTRLTHEEVERIVRDVNDQLQAMHTELNFSVDKETEKLVLKIINSKTHEVIRQIPAEEALRIAARLSKLLGLLFDENA